MSDIITLRDIDTITTEIKTIEGQVQRFAIYGCIEIGKRLVEAKEMVGHGGWGKYLEEKVSYSQQWATNLMNLYKEYGTAQESLFESFANSQSFGNIDVTKHILLLSVPAEEREAFAAEHDAENASTRELQAAIKERDAAKEVADTAEALAREMAEQLDEAGEKLAAKSQEIQFLQAKVEAAEKKQVEATGKVDKLNEKLKRAVEAEKTAKELLAKAQANPEIPEAMMEEMRQQVAISAAQQATAEIKKQLEAAQIAAEEAENRRIAAEAKVAEAEKKAKASSPEVALVSVYLQETQAQFNKMVGAIKKVEAVDPETGKKLRQNVKEKLLPALMKALEG